jgi:hypothetical protein
MAIIAVRLHHSQWAANRPVWAKQRIPMSMPGTQLVNCPEMVGAGRDTPSARRPESWARHRHRHRHDADDLDRADIAELKTIHGLGAELPQK